MKINWQKEIHTGWRQALGALLLVLGITGSVFYYTDLRAAANHINTINNDLNTKVLARQAAATPLPGSSVAPSAESNMTGKIKISTATQEELETLPRIGPSKAKAILDYRAKFGFKSINDLTKVAGIGAKTLEQLKPLIEL